MKNRWAGKAGRTYPYLTIHGGPAGMFGFDWYHEFQVYASRRVAVFFNQPARIDRHGEKFERGIELKLGRQRLPGRHERRRRGPREYPWVDKDRLGRHRRQATAAS